MTEEWTTEDIARRFGKTQRTVTEKWTKAPDFPPPVRRISRRSVWWRAEDVLRWSEARAKQ